MKVKLLKDHPHGKAGQVVDVTDERGNYLIRSNVAEKDEETDSEVIKEKKEIKQQPEKKAHSGLPTATKKKGRPRKS